MNRFIQTLLVALLPIVAAEALPAQNANNPAKPADTPAVSSYEQELSRALTRDLQEFSPKTDNLGNVWVSVGSGEPHRLIATGMDQPGYIVSAITSDGFLRVQRLPQAAPNGVFDALNFAQPVWVLTRTGKKVSGVFAGLSVHLQPARVNGPKMTHPDEMYVDLGAKSPEEVRAAGVDVLDPIVPQTNWMAIGKDGVAGLGALNHVDIGVLTALIGGMKTSKVKGTTTIAFVAQQYNGGRGLNRILTEIQPNEMIYVGRARPEQPANGKVVPESPKPGAGTVLGLPSTATEAGQSFLTELQGIAEKEHIKSVSVTAAAPRITSYTKGAEIPGRFVGLGVPTIWPVTPAESASRQDVEQMQRLLEAYLDVQPPIGEGNGGFFGATRQGVLRELVEAYGVSRHEEAVRKVVLNRLDARLRSKVTLDGGGNLVLHLGDGKKDAKTPRIAIVAHMDEIGYEVKKIEDDGRLQVDSLGGGYAQYFLGHVVLIHKKDGSRTGGVLELPNGWEKAGFEWPLSMRSIDEPAHVYVGTQSKKETEELGIEIGDFITIPKEYRELLGTRANARSFDDRVGCAALITAANAIGPDLPGRDVTFVWSTREEVGLEGAGAFADQAAKEGRSPDFVFAIDTFVSSDSPLESKRFADATIGNGFVVRAVDNSNTVPREYVDRVVAMAREHSIPVQYGVTGGGNDGAVFVRYGSVDVAMGWPLRYAHSPGEVIDTKDVDALGKIVEAIARQW
ncbi:MAG TPA: M20/M25/M40 family metallo-hydrolase [Candidatus Sulfotelmatobacter sp.]|jgi:putative aminopeptidase FrvX|nr:M20/M25/M40 family metallo-hydrolase [Candidatus Sulfotelmatobacter sp.]